MIKSKRSMAPRSGKHVWTTVIVLVLIFIGLWIASMFLGGKREFFQSKKITVNYYYLEKCPFCVKFKPEWDKFVTMSSGKYDTNAVDGTKQEVYKSFPTIEVVVGTDKPREYTGERTASALMDFVRTFE